MVCDLQRDLDSHNFEYTVGLTTPETVMTNMATGQRFTGPEGMHTFLTGWVSAFPDAQVEVTDLICGDENVVIAFTARGTHTGPL